MTTPNAYVILPAEATEEIASVGAASLDRPNVFMGGPSPLQKRRAKDAYRAMLSASPNSGRVTAEMLEAATIAYDACPTYSVEDGIRAAFEAIGLTVEA